MMDGVHLAVNEFLWSNNMPTYSRPVYKSCHRYAPVQNQEHFQINLSKVSRQISHPDCSFYFIHSRREKEKKKRFCLVRPFTLYTTQAVKSHRPLRYIHKPLTLIKQFKSRGQAFFSFSFPVREGLENVRIQFW